VEVAGNGGCEFAHDRIQESAYTRVGEKKRKQLHAAIGLQWLKTYGYSPDTETLYEIARHLFLGLEYLPDGERMNYILLNYKCGDRAKERAAFSAAFEYFSRAIHLLAPGDWYAHYDLVLNLFIGGSESAAIIGERGVAEAWAQLVVDHADTLQTKFRGFEVKLNILNENHEMLQAVELLLRLLNELGFKIKRKPTNVDLLIELVKTKKVLWNRRIHDLEHLKPMSNEAALLFMRLSAKCTTSIFSAAPELLPLIVFKQVQLSVRYGNSPYSPVGYAAYGFALSSILGQLDRGFQFGELAIRIAASNNSAEVLAKVGAMFYGFLSYWKNDIRKSIPALKKTYTTGRETGDLLYASFAATFHSCLLFFTGEKLDVVQQLMEEDSSLIKEMKQDLVYIVSENQRQMVQHLTKPSGRPLSITGAEPTEEQFVQKLLDKKDAATLFDFYVYKVILCYLLEDPVTTFNFAQKAFEQEDETSSQQMSYPYFMLFTALAAAGAYQISPQKKYIRRIKIARNKLKRIVEHAPDNFKAMYELTTGAYYSVKGQNELALKYYSQGIESARANRFIHLQAIGYDLLGNHYVRNEAWAHADMVLKKAHATYASWGAMAKCFKLEMQYPELFVDLHADRSGPAKNILIHTNILSEANNTFSYVSDVNQLLRNLLRMITDLCEVNSLQLLFRQKDDTFQVKAWVRGTEFIINKSDNASSEVPSFPLSVINFINRSKQSLLSENAENDQRFYMDSYFRENNVTAFIGFPIVRNDKLLAIIYIENIKPATGFRHDIAGMLQSISMLMGISVENALLIEEHERVSILEKDFNNNLLAISHSAEENERKRIAAELHDDIGALLSTTKLYLTHQQNDSSPTQKKAQAILDKAIQNLRQISHQLSPASLEQFGLVTGIKGMIHDIQQTGAIRVVLDSNLSERLTQSQELQLYRIFQELFNNTLKYSKATHATVRIEKKNNRLECEFTDNGIGFDIDAVTNSHQPGKGIGLQNITSRARTINGKLYLHSAPGKGVSMKLEVKL
jgi:signal transduction histidine kinase